MASFNVNVQVRNPEMPSQRAISGAVLKRVAKLMQIFGVRSASRVSNAGGGYSLRRIGDQLAYHHNQRGFKCSLEMIAKLLLIGGLFYEIGFSLAALVLRSFEDGQPLKRDLYDWDNGARIRELCEEVGSKHLFEVLGFHRPYLLCEDSMPHEWGFLGSELIVPFKDILNISSAPCGQKEVDANSEGRLNLIYLQKSVGMYQLEGKMARVLRAQLGVNRTLRKLEFGRFYLQIDPTSLEGVWEPFYKERFKNLILHEISHVAEAFRFWDLNESLRERVSSFYTHRAPAGRGGITYRFESFERKSGCEFKIPFSAHKLVAKNWLWNIEFVSFLVCNLRYPSQFNADDLDFLKQRNRIGAECYSGFNRSV